MAGGTDNGAKSKNIQAAPPGSVKWDPADLAKSLENLLAYVEGQADRSIDWYWKNKRWKSRLSRFIQFAAIALTAGAGIVPIINQLWKAPGSISPFDSGLLASVFVGIAAALLGLDKSFGFSTGWARYVLTATSIRKALEEFRLDWASLSAGLSQPPKPEQVTAIIQRAKDFISTTEGLVLQETKDWVAEFQGNMAQIEKDVKAQLDALKAQTDKAAQSKEAATKPGAIELTVPNADKADGFKFQVILENQSGKVADESVTNAKSWSRINVDPGHYRLTASAAVGGKAIASSSVIDVKPGEVTKPSAPLPIS